MRHISETVYGMLMRQAIANAQPVGAGKVRGIGDGERSRERALNHQPTGEGGELRSMGMKRTPAEPAPVNRGKRQTQPVRKSAGFDYVVHLNHAADNMPARKTTKRNTSVAFLTCMDGGRK